MEIAVVVLAGAIAVAALIIAAVVLLKVVGPRSGNRPVLRPRSTAGFPWLMLGIAGTIVFALVDLSILLPLLIALGGLVAVVVGVYRQWKNGM